MASVRPGGENRSSSFDRRSAAERNRNRGGSSSDNNNRSNRSSGSSASSGSGSSSGSSSDNGSNRRTDSRRRAGSAYGARGPERRDSGYGFDIDQEIAGPSLPQASERFDVWARDVLDREGPPERREVDTLSEGLDAHQNYQAAQFAGSLASAINPVAGPIVKGAEYVYSQQQSPEYQAARDVSQDASPFSDTLGYAGGLLNTLAPQTGPIGSFLGPFLGAAEADAGLFSEIRTFTGRDRARDAFPQGGESDDRDTTILPPQGLAGQGAPGSMAAGFQAPSAFNYATFLDKFTRG